MRKLASLFVSFVFAAALYGASGDKVLELPAEKFRVSRIGKINADETGDRFRELWFLFGQQYDFAAGKFVRKDPKGSGRDSKRFAFRADCVARVSDKAIFCRLPGAAKATIFMLETAAKSEPNAPVSVWAEPAGAEEYKGVSYPKFREITSGSGVEKLPALPAEADVQKAFLAAITAGTTFPVEIVETRNCAVCYGSGKVSEKSETIKLISGKISCEACSGTGKRTVKVDVVLQN